VDNNLTKRQKIRKLSNEFSIKMTPSLERGVKKMCNLSEGVERRGIEKGMARGLKQGMARGLEQGIARGLTEGREQMATDMALDMLRDNKPMEEVIKYTRLPLERIQELAEQVIK
jgi:flagellar biosynthesis/type III secretory pathway protein FliH